MNDIHELLGRAADGAGSPGFSAGAVYARADRVRRRRRAVVSAVAVVVIAAGAFTVPRLGGGGGPRTSVATEPRPTGSPTSPAPVLTGTRAERLAALLPPEVGEIEQVTLLALIKQLDPDEVKETYLGPLDGQYAIRKDGGVGYLVLTYEDRATVESKLGRPADPDEDPCPAMSGDTYRTNCVREVLPDGRVLTLWNDAMRFRGGDEVRWGPELTGELVQRDGSQILVRSSTGFESTGTQGPLLPAPPVSREHLRALLTSPEVLPKTP